MQPNIIIVSNRLPVSVKKSDKGLEYFPSVGGLATGLSSYVEGRKNIWIGWPGIPSDDLTPEDRSNITKELKKHNCLPVFLTKQQIEDFYNGYSNSILWPVSHNLPVKAKAKKAWWPAFETVNQLFSDVVAKQSKADSTIWVHDYQLMLLPGMLRDELPAAQIGFFLHTPFASADPFVALPEARELTNGLLGSDLVGFHTKAYAEEFIEACKQLDVGVANGDQVVMTGHVAKIAEFPIGIDYNKFARAAQIGAVRTERRRLNRLYRKYKVILTVDRLDYTKGLKERVQAYYDLLDKHPELHKKVIMVMLAMPSRTDIPEYKQLKDDMEALVAKTNKKFGDAKWQPIDYMFTALPFEQVSALYQVADVAFITPIRDGMNLVAKEYVASKTDKRGVLILSSTAGAAAEMTDALLVDPAKPETVVRALEEALAMSDQDIKRRIIKMQKRLSDFTVHEWAGSFMNNLRQPVTTKRRTKSLTPTSKSSIKRAYQKATHRLILLDYDGVLSAFAKKPEDAKPTPEAMDVVKRLSGDQANEVVIVSGRSRADLDSWFGALPVAIAAEHGALFRRKGGKAWHKTGQISKTWKATVKGIMEEYAGLTPGSHVEDKEWSLVWHYREASAYTAQKNLVLVKRLLRPIARQYGLILQDGKMILEARPAGINKGRAAQEWLLHEHDFVLAIGDDKTDEDTFAVVPPAAHSIKVGRGRTLARWRVASQRSVLPLLKSLIN